MTAISTNGISYGIGVDTILRDVSFSLEEGDRLGVVGVNGSGKSTLLRILSGELEADSGELYISRGSTVGILHQNDAFNIIESSGDTVLEQMYAAFPTLLALEERIASLEAALSETGDSTRIASLSDELESANRRYAEQGGLYFRSRCRSMLCSLGFDESYHSLPISGMSGGQRTRIALARLLAREVDILLLDEPTNHLDTETLEWLEEHLSAYKKTVIVVSHDRYFLDRVTTKTLDVENNTAKLYGVPYSLYTEQKRRDREIAEKKYELQQKEIARLEAFIENQRRWNRERNIIAAESREKAIARMEKVERPADAPKSVSFSIDSSGESGNDVLELKDLAVRFPGRELFSHLDLLLKKRDRLFIMGKNGCGKSTLIRVLMGMQQPSEGTLELGYNVTVGYYAQENQSLVEENTVLEELWSAHPRLTQTEIRNTLAMFMFRGDDIEKRVAVLSGGERARLTIAKLILSKMNLLILDEPTNHLDIASREALENALEAFDGTLIAVSHDRYFVKRLATRFVSLSPSGCRQFFGSYDSFKTSLEAPPAAAPAAGAPESTSVGGKEDYLRRKAENAKLRRASRRLEAIADECDRLELRIAELDDALCGPEGSDYKRAAELSDEKCITEDRLMQLYEEEEELRELLASSEP